MRSLFEEQARLEIHKRVHDRKSKIRGPAAVGVSSLLIRRAKKSIVT